MVIKIGETLDYGGKQFVVVLLNQEESLEGGVLLIRAYDPDMASKIQQKNIVAEQTGDQIMGMIRKMTEGGPGNIGFGIGG